MTSTRVTADVRPRLVSRDGHTFVAGARCSGCDLPTAERLPSCPRCGGVLDPEEFGPLGTVWSWTTVHLNSEDRPAGHTFAYVDLEAGPRILALHEGSAAVDQTVVIRAVDVRGDIVVAAEVGQ